MENSNLTGRILMEMEDLIAQSCPQQKVDQHFESLHVDLIKKYYNATEVSIDYHRKRVEMDLVVNDTDYDPKTVNLYLPTLHVNLRYRDLRDFLKSCVDQDTKSIVFYACLIRKFKGKGRQLMTA
ncbi:MAG: hypothetical protein Mars2KO_30280 [Maribacter sp.]|uniref:hypothetical protein n=1 Tax=Maribacter sp. 2307UL18-2 TaxID=3386274 RepID=UPI0039BCA3B5